MGGDVVKADTDVTIKLVEYTTTVGEVVTEHFYTGTRTGKTDGNGVLKILAEAGTWREDGGSYTLTPVV